MAQSGIPQRPLLVGRRILIIDDNDEFVEAFTALLNRMGAQVDAAPRGLDGLLAVEQQPYDLVVLDLLLPDAHGWDVFAQLREIRSRQDLAVVFLSASVDVQEAEAMSSSRAIRTRTLSKHALPEDILASILEILER